MGTIDSIGGAKLQMDDNGVYCSSDRLPFDYSDGRDVEIYLESVLRECGDLSTESYELESYSKDWATEYHLSRKRAQLLSAFSFSRKSKVLEVGCGCGSITRILGERFENVIAVEGSYNRAKLARMRCRDLENVTVVCSPYQTLNFDGEFDFVFCIGVLEYAGYLVGGNDPYLAALESFSKALRPDGVLVVAIENQYGLKYFSKASEDHTNRMFEGIEGYPIYRDIVRTFGREELRCKIGRHFENVEFYYPYPDYKVPDCVLSESFLREAQPAELLGALRSRDYVSNKSDLFSEKLAYRDLAINGLLPYFSNSFLVFAGNRILPKLNNAEGVLFSTGRLPAYSTVTYFERDRTSGDDGYMASKTLRYPLLEAPPSREVRLSSCKSQWYGGRSLHGLMLEEILRKEIGWEALGHLVRAWRGALEREARLADGETLLPGAFLDATWKNCFFENGVPHFIDLEWSFSAGINLELLFLRSFGILVDDLVGIKAGRKALAKTSSMSLLKTLGKSAGLRVNNRDINSYADFEHDFQTLVTSDGAYFKKIAILISLRLPHLVWFSKIISIRLNALVNIQKRTVRFIKNKFL